MPKDQSQFTECISTSLTDVLSSGSCPPALQRADLAAGGAGSSPLAGELLTNPVTNITEAQKMPGREMCLTALLQVTVYGSGLLGGPGAS